MTRRAAALRLLALVGALGTLAAVFVVGGLVGPQRVRDWVEPLGVAGPLLYVPLSAVLGTLLVPAVALAAASGLLFGPWVGALCSVAAGALATLLSRAVSSRAGREPFDALASERMQALAGLAREHGVLAVIIARLAPWLPDGPVSHAFGIVGLRPRTVLIGHLIAATPRAFAYGLIGSSVDHPTGTTALLGWALNITTGVVGTVLLVAVVVRRRRSTERMSGESAPEATGE